eukprot:gb/GEZN01000922.1/.p1 GENE.gb/GEZN01000922.1/~~gb/GEZN01000922.1/.p1  ORF type:complete len:710 (-),score=108.79 gb/GEZN01000922.1/:247-2376(-)
MKQLHEIENELDEGHLRARKPGEDGAVTEEAQAISRDGKQTEALTVVPKENQTEGSPTQGNLSKSKQTESPEENQTIQENLSKGKQTERPTVQENAARGEQAEQPAAPARQRVVKPKPLPEVEGEDTQRHRQVGTGIEMQGSVLAIANEYVQPDYNASLPPSSLTPPPLTRRLAIHTYAIRQSNWYQRHRHYSSYRVFAAYVAAVVLIHWCFFCILIYTDSAARYTSRCSDSRGTYLMLIFFLLQLAVFSLLGYQISQLKNDNFGMKQEIRYVSISAGFSVLVWMLWQGTENSAQMYNAGDIFSQLCYLLIIWFCFLVPSYQAWQAKNRLKPKNIKLGDLLNGKVPALTEEFFDFMSSEFSTENFLFYQETQDLFTYVEACLGNKEADVVVVETDSNSVVVPLKQLAESETNVPIFDSSPSPCSPDATNRMTFKDMDSLPTPQGIPSPNSPTVSPPSPQQPWHSRNSSRSSIVKRFTRAESSESEPSPLPPVVIDVHVLHMIEDEAKNVHDVYISSGGYRQVNLASQTASTISKHMDKLHRMPWTDLPAKVNAIQSVCQALKKAQEEIYKLISMDTFPRFLLTLTSTKLQALSGSYGDTSRSHSRSGSLSKQGQASVSRGHSRQSSRGHSRQTSKQEFSPEFVAGVLRSQNSASPPHSRAHSRASSSFQMTHSRQHSKGSNVEFSAELNVPGAPQSVSPLTHNRGSNFT